MKLAAAIRAYLSGGGRHSFDTDDPLMLAPFHPDAHEDNGGLACNDRELLAQMRECIMAWIRSMGREILRGNLNLVNTSFPVLMFEPRSYLQKLADIWAYPDLIDAAALQRDDPLERMKLLVAWLVAGLHHSVESWKKPFNPILGETWQAAMPDGTRLSMEQVSHHPPVSAYQLEGPGGAWRLSGWSQPAVVPVVKFYGIKTVAKGARRIEFADGSVVEMSMPHFAIKGVVYAAKPHVEVLGVARLVDRANHLEAVVSFGPVAGTRQRVLARADAVCGEIYQRPRAAHLQAAAAAGGGALLRSPTSTVPLDDLDAELDQLAVEDGGSEGGDSADTAPPPAAAAAAAADDDDAAGPSGGGDGDPDDEAILAEFNAQHFGGGGSGAGCSSSNGGGGAAVAANGVARGAAAAAAAAGVDPTSSDVAPRSRGGAASPAGAHERSSPLHRSKTSLDKRALRAANAGGAGGAGGGAGAGAGRGGVPGVAVARIEGSWLSHLNVDNVRYWTLAEATPQRWRPSDAPLPSDSRFRRDLAALAGGDLEGAQHWKEVLEQHQRADRKLREAAGVWEHH